MYPRIFRGGNLILEKQEETKVSLGPGVNQKYQTVWPKVTLKAVKQMLVHVAYSKVV